MMIRDGQAIASGRAAELLTPERLEQLYSVAIETVLDPEGPVAFLPG